MGELPKNIFRFISFILVQVFILNKIPPLHQFVTPYLYFLFILWLPFKVSRPALTFIGFIFGLSLDYFTKTPGLHAAACCLVAYIRPFVINILISKEDSGYNYTSPAPSSMGWSQYMVYVFVLSLAHNFWLVFLEWLQLRNFLYLVGKIIATTGVSFLLIMITEGLFFRKQKFKTNI
ncbi:MAG: rod shape-determining protein MreD [Chitinophagaceae bacterium]|nr:rod shape-determining protein MreD [Chitinophagaceae bacterium]MCW5929363.1 rod shape-determining protein MreD [Chitinophagaceae bacterium]